MIIRDRIGGIKEMMGMAIMVEVIVDSLRKEIIRIVAIIIGKGIGGIIIGKEIRVISIEIEIMMMREGIISKDIVIIEVESRNMIEEGTQRDIILRQDTKDKNNTFHPTIATNTKKTKTKQDNILVPLIATIQNKIDHPIILS